MATYLLNQLPNRTWEKVILYGHDKRPSLKGEMLFLNFESLSALLSYDSHHVTENMISKWFIFGHQINNELIFGGTLLTKPEKIILYKMRLKTFTLEVLD